MRFEALVFFAEQVLVQHVQEAALKASGCISRRACRRHAFVHAV